MRYARAHILLLSVGLEGALGAVFLVWTYYRDYDFGTIPTLTHLGLGILGCLPLFILNYTLFGPLSHKVPALRSCFEFKDKVVKPLADQLNVFDSFVVAVSAGFGEELFFRGVLQNEFGIVLASILFSVLHFGPSVTKYVFIAFLYCVIGAYFGILYEKAQTLWVPIITHSIYDFIALLYMRYLYRSPRMTLEPAVS